jgi:predicted nucleotidyltransferase
MLPKKSLYKSLAERNERKKKYFQNYLIFAKRIKKKATRILNNPTVLVFGSVIRKEYLPNSDIDILVISPDIPDDLFEKTKIKIELTKDFDTGIFEIHLATHKMYENWYKNFIKDDFVKI